MDRTKVASIRWKKLGVTISMTSDANQEKGTVGSEKKRLNAKLLFE